MNERQEKFLKTKGKVIDCDFKELCDRPLGSKDYLTLADEFDTLLLRNIPKFSRRNMSQAKRFITLIDTVYDAKVR